MEINRFKNFLIRRVGVPMDFCDLPIGDMQRDDENRQVLDWFQGLAENLEKASFFDEPVQLILKGVFGSGKTRLACGLLTAAAWGWQKRQHSHYYPQFMYGSALGRYRFDTGVDDWADTLEFLERSCFLVIDDAFRGPGYKGEQDFLEYLLDRRVGNRLSTVLTTNEKPDNMGSERFSKSFIKCFQLHTLPSRDWR